MKILQKKKSIKEIISLKAHAYLQLVEHDVAKLIPSSELVSTINSIDKDQIWKNSDSEKRKKFLEDYFNYGNYVDLLQLIE